MKSAHFSKKVISILIITLLSGSLSSCGKETANKGILAEEEINQSSDDDLQSSFNSSAYDNVAKGENGYYFLSSGSMNIMYFDKESLTSFPLCGKADCKHTDDTCNSYLGRQTHIPSTIYYYKGYIYIIKINGGDAILERVNADGSARKELGIICPTRAINNIHLVFYSDTIYVFDGGDQIYSDTEQKNVISKFSLDGKSQGNVFEYTGKNIVILSGTSYGNKLYFLMRQITKDVDGKLIGTNLGLFAYDYATQETEQVKDSNINDYCVDVKNSIIYYFVVGDGLYKYSITTKENNKIFEAGEDTGICNIAYDGKNLYMNNIYWCVNQKVYLKKILDSKCWIINTDGSFKNTIDCNGIFYIYYGDENFLIASKMNNSSPESLAYINMKDIENAKGWTPLVSTVK